MIIKSNLIHSGLPWTSPQKIAISSSQYISNAIINRSLLHLLNNDYYLDIKTQAINKYIEENLVTHITNQDVHVPWSRIQQLLSSYNLLDKDTIYYIPIIFNNTKLSASEINDIIAKIPKNINGFTVVLYFCKAGTANYLNDITNKLAINNINNNLLNLNNKSINIESFNGGDVIIYSDSSEFIELEGYQTIDQLKANTMLNRNIFNNIQEIINRNTFDSSNSNRLTISSTGINQNYSTLCIKNCSANVYLINMTIKNNISNWSDISKLVIDATLLPSNDDVLLYYQLNYMNSNNTIPYVESYLNKQMLNKNATYYLNITNKIDQDCFGNIDSFNKGGGVNINNINYINSKPEQPQYFLFDNPSLNNYSVSNEIRELLYDWKKIKNNYTIMFLGKINQELFSNNQPIFADYNNIGKEFGLYVYLNKIFATSQEIIDRSQYITEFNSNYNSIIGKNGMFVIQFVHSAINYTSSIPGNIASTPITKDVEKNKEYMRINIIFYPIPDNLDEDISKYPDPFILSPNISTINSIAQLTNNSDKELKFINTNYQFEKPLIQNYQNNNIPIKLFANKRLNNITDKSLKAWDYYSGYVKNLLFFNKILTKNEILNLIKEGKANSFDWVSSIEKNIINKITTDSFIGTIYVNNSNNVNLINSKIETTISN